MKKQVERTFISQWSNLSVMTQNLLNAKIVIVLIVHYIPK